MGMAGDQVHPTSYVGGPKGSPGGPFSYTLPVAAFPGSTPRGGGFPLLLLDHPGAPPYAPHHVPSLYPPVTMSDEWGMPGLSAERERLLVAVTTGHPITRAAEMVGMSRTAAVRYLSSPQGKDALDQLRGNVRRQVQFGINDAHEMYMETYAQAHEPRDQVKVIDSLVALHGLAPDPRNGPVVTVNLQQNVTAAEIASMSDAQLLEAAGTTQQALEPAVAVPRLKDEPIEEAEWKDAAML